jgi:hypothetical protein
MAQWKPLNIPSNLEFTDDLSSYEWTTFLAAENFFSKLQKLKYKFIGHTHLCEPIVYIERQHKPLRVVEIEPFAFTQFFLRKDNLTDEFSNVMYNGINLRAEIICWLNEIYTIIQRELLKHKDSQYFTIVEIEELQGILQFINLYKGFES